MSIVFKNKNSFFKKFIIYSVACVSVLFSAISFAGEVKTIGDVAGEITSSLGKLAQLITAGSYVAGFGFAVGAILKFKAHKDNPTQIPVGTPIALLFIAAALIFLPSIFGVAGETMFGTKTGSGGVSGTISF